MSMTSAGSGSEAELLTTLAAFLIVPSRSPRPAAAPCPGLQSSPSDSRQSPFRLRSPRRACDRSFKNLGPSSSSIGAPVLFSPRFPHRARGQGSSLGGELMEHSSVKPCAMNANGAPSASAARQASAVFSAIYAAAEEVSCRSHALIVHVEP